MKLRFYSISLGLLFLASLLTNVAVARDYLSANVFISARGFSSLEKIIKDMVKIKPHLRTKPLDKLNLKAKKCSDLHMTLHALNIDVVQNLTQSQKDMLQAIVQEKFKKIAEQEIQKTLNYVHKKGQKGITLPFVDLEIYNRFFVATFNLRGTQQKPSLLTQLIFNIDVQFQQALKQSVRLNNKKLFPTYPIKSIKWTYNDIKPHVSLAKIQDTFLNNKNPYVGITVQSPIIIPNFTITKPEVVSSVLWLQK